MHLTDNVIANRFEDGKSWRLSGESLNLDHNGSCDIQDYNQIVQGESKSIGDELVINLNTNELTLEDVRTKWRSDHRTIWVGRVLSFCTPEDRDQPIETLPISSLTK